MTDNEIVFIILLRIMSVKQLFEMYYLFELFIFMAYKDSVGLIGLGVMGSASVTKFLEINDIVCIFYCIKMRDSLAAE